MPAKDLGGIEDNGDELGQPASHTTAVTYPGESPTSQEVSGLTDPQQGNLLFNVHTTAVTYPGESPTSQEVSGLTDPQRGNLLFNVLVYHY